MKLKSFWGLVLVAAMTMAACGGNPPAEEETPVEESMEEPAPEPAETMPAEPAMEEAEEPMMEEETAEPAMDDEGMGEDDAM